MTRKERLRRMRLAAQGRAMALLEGIMWGSLAALVVAASSVWM